MKWVPVLLLILVLAGCRGGNPNVYYWGQYPDASYAYLRGDLATPEEQLEVLLATLETAKRKEWRVPPGLHGQIGLVYARLGDGVRAREHWRMEMALFPSSEAYMNFVLEAHEP